MYLSLDFLKRCILLVLIFWATPEASAEWRKASPEQTTQNRPAKTRVSKLKPQSTQTFGMVLLTIGTMLALLAIIGGLAAAIIFGSTGLVVWGAIALGCGFYAGVFSGGVIVDSTTNGYGMGAAIGTVLGLMGVIFTAVLTGLPLLVFALISGISWLILSSSILLGILGLIIFLALSFA